jgi:ATP-binding cassette subfamily C protein/ATP-binding cassette subfamily C protein LapB
MTAAAATIKGLRERGPESLLSALSAGRLGTFRAATDLAVCLMPLLEALNWRGNPRDIAEAMPHYAEELDLVGLRNTLANLNFHTEPLALPLERIDPRLMPCLFLPERGGATVVLGRDQAGVLIFDGRAGEVRTAADPSLSGTAYFITRIEPDLGAPAAPAARPWFREVTHRFRRIVTQTLAMSLLLNLLALTIPIFTMVVYDKVIGAGSHSTLIYLAMGMALVLGFDMIFRVVRARMLAYVGARLDMIVGAGSFNHLLHLPTAQTEGATIGAQVARLKQFEAIRDFFTGPLALVYIELPFVPIFLVVIAVLAGPLAVIPVVMIALFAVIGAILFPRIRDAVEASSKTVARRQSFLVEMLSNMRAIKSNGAEAEWNERFQEISSKTALSGFRMGQLAGLVQTFAHVLMLSAGLATLAFGIIRVLGGDMTVGALIATMALIWRVLSPLNAGFLTLTKLEQVRSGIRSINNLMRLPAERHPNASSTTHKQFTGRLTFSRVSLRYRADLEPALIGVSFDIQPGEIVGIAGANGSGKSSILKMILGLYRPQAGGVMLDGLDIRQIDPIELRNKIGYVPQTTQLFHGTIAQNLRLADPTVSEEDLRRAASEAGVLGDIEALPQGFETWIGDQSAQAMPSGLIQRLSLARAYLKDAPVLLFDEPANALDDKGDTAIIRQLERLRGHATVLLVTHRPSHMRICDRLIVLDGGAIAFDGTPDEVFRQLPAGSL